MADETMDIEEQMEDYHDRVSGELAIYRAVKLLSDYVHSVAPSSHRVARALGDLMPFLESAVNALEQHVGRIEELRSAMTEPDAEPEVEADKAPQAQAGPPAPTPKPVPVPVVPASVAPRVVPTAMAPTVPTPVQSTPVIPTPVAPVTPVADSTKSDK